MALLIVSEIRHYREALANALAALDEFSEVKTSCSLGTALFSSSEFKPDIVVLDLLGQDDLAFMEEAMRKWPKARFVAIALLGAQADLLACIRMGVQGLVTRDQSLQEMISILRRTLGGEYCWSNRVTATLIRHIEGTVSTARPGRVEASAMRRRSAPISAPPRRTPAPQTAPAEERTDQLVSECKLTARQGEVLNLLGDGLSNKEIARKLDIELPTVKHHVHEVLRKLGVSRRTAAIARLHRGTGTSGEARAPK